MKLKDKIAKWIHENHNHLVTPDMVKQTNITARKQHGSDFCYFIAGPYTSNYTMKRWLEIAENKLYDTWTVKHGSWYWIKDNKVIN